MSSVALSSAELALTAGSPECPMNAEEPGWFKAVKLCYKIGLERDSNQPAGGLTFNEAVAKCASYSKADCPASLLTVANAAEVLDNHRVENNRQLRIDSCYDVGQGLWVDHAGNAVTFPPPPYSMSSTSPYSAIAEDKFSAFLALEPNKIYGNLDVGAHSGYICQSCIDESYEPITCPLNDNEASDPWISGNGVCYRIVSTKEKYRSASNACMQYNTTTCSSQLLKVENVKPVIDDIVDKGQTLPDAKYRLDGKYSKRANVWITQEMDVIRFPGHPMSKNGTMPFDVMPSFKYSLTVNLATGRISGNTAKKDEEFYICESCTSQTLRKK